MSFGAAQRSTKHSICTRMSIALQSFLRLTNLYFTSKHHCFEFIWHCHIRYAKQSGKISKIFTKNELWSWIDGTQNRHGIFPILNFHSSLTLFLQRRNSSTVAQSCNLTDASVTLMNPGIDSYMTETMLGSTYHKMKKPRSLRVIMAASIGSCRIASLGSFIDA